MTGSPPSRPTFVGFAEDEPCLSEFLTTSGHTIVVDELRCVSIDYRPVTGTMRVVFDDDATDELPAITVIITFEGVGIPFWHPVGEPLTQDVIDSVAHDFPRLRGQVEGLDWFRAGHGVPGHDTFMLGLIDFALSFSASVVTCEVREGTMWEPEDGAF